MPSLTLFVLVATFSFGPGQQAKVPLRYFEQPQQCIVASAKSAVIMANESTLMELKCSPMPVNVQPPQQGGPQGGRGLPPEDRQREADHEIPQAHPHEEHL